jgi:hypothetical protein
MALRLASGTHLYAMPRDLRTLTSAKARCNIRVRSTFRSPVTIPAVSTTIISTATTAPITNPINFDTCTFSITLIVDMITNQMYDYNYTLLSSVRLLLLLLLLLLLSPVPVILGTIIPTIIWMTLVNMR